MLGPGGFYMVVWAALSAILWIGIPVAIFVFARRLLRAIERRSVQESQVAELSERLQRLEAQYLDLANDNERLREAQRFTQQLLVARTTSDSGSVPSAT